jgi:hypothetical protein
MAGSSPPSLSSTNKPPPALSTSKPSKSCSAKYKASKKVTSKKDVDVRNHMVIEGLQEGIMSVYVKKFNVEEEAFLGPDLKLLQKNAGTIELLGIHAILYRKGVDGATAMMQSPGTNYAWSQFILIVGEEACKDPQERLKIANKLLAYFNANATDGMYKFPRKMKLGEDKTQDPPRPVDAVLLDNDVIAMMQTAYPALEFHTLAAYDTIAEMQAAYPELHELSAYETIVKKFWTDINYGQKAMLSFGLFTDNW